MRYMVGLSKAFIWIYRFSLIVVFALVTGCGTENFCTNKNRNTKNKPATKGFLLKPSIQLSKIKKAHKDSLKQGYSKTLSAISHVKKVKNIKKSIRVARVPEHKQTIVLFHGLHRLSYDFHNMEKKLKERFPYATIIALKSVDKNLDKKKLDSPTMKKSIKDQAALAYQEIKNKVSAGNHVVFVGHSQGGLRAFTVIKEYVHLLKNESNIDIKKLISIGTPWKGAPVFSYHNNVLAFDALFDKIAVYLDSIRAGYSKHIRKYFLKVMPEFSKKHYKLREKLLQFVNSLAPMKGATDLDPKSDFISNYIARGLNQTDIPITAIAGILTDFSKLFHPFDSPLTHQELAQINATYAELIGGYATCEHDMLLPVSTQHAEGLMTKNFNRIKVYGACHGNKVGISVKRGLSELNNPEVIEQVVKVIDETFYEQKEEMVTEQATQPALAA